MPRKTGAIIPDPISPSGTYRRVICIPGSPEWIALVNGALWVMTQAWYWDAATGDVDAVVDRAKQMYFEFQDETGDCDPPMWTPGDVKMFAGLTYPLDGWLLCDGASLLRADYPALFAELGTQWGAADSTHFNIPDYRGRSPMGEGKLDGDTDNHLWQMGNKTGEQEVTLTTAQIPAHQHLTYSAALYTVVAAGGASAGIGGGVSDTNIKTGNTGDGEPHENYHPVQTIRFFIYTGE